MLYRLQCSPAGSYSLAFLLVTSWPLHYTFDMLRVAFSRSVVAARLATSARSPAPLSRIALQHIRWESSTAPDQRKQQLEAADELRRDWDAKVITYEELKPKTTQPSPVRA